LYKNRLFWQSSDKKIRKVFLSLITEDSDSLLTLDCYKNSLRLDLKLSETLILSRNLLILTNMNKNVYRSCLSTVANFAYVCIYMPREYIMWWRRSNIIYWQPYGTLQTGEKKESKLTRWHLKRHTAFTVSLFSLSLCLCLDSLLIFRYSGRQAKHRYFCLPSTHIYYFIRKFYKKPAGYMCYTFSFFFTLLKNSFVVPILFELLI